MGFDLPGVHAAPNIQQHPDVYEIENRAVDPEQLIEARMHAIAPWDDKVVLDLGAGTGYHIPRFHTRASHVIAVEPHGPSRVRAMARVAALGLERASVLAGSAERIVLPDASVDVVHARFAYFFGPGCEPGLAELARVIRPGGAAFIIDNDLRRGTFAAWLRRAAYFAEIDPDARDRFWADQGFALATIPSAWRFDRREDLEAVVCIEFPPDLAEQLIAEHAGLTVDYWYSLYYRRY
jgi:ubiquinone/menaquinone biosynthesis C-methylase UbiE